MFFLQHFEPDLRTVLLLSLLADVGCLDYLGPSRGFAFHMLDELIRRRGCDVDPLLLKPSSESGFLQQVNKIGVELGVHGFRERTLRADTIP